jgi:hypothetical protein
LGASPVTTRRGGLSGPRHHVAEALAQGLGGLGSRVGLLLQAVEEQRLERRGQVRPQRRGRRRRLRRVRHHQRERLRVHERRPPGEDLVQHDAERVQVGAGVDGLAAGLLGRHVAAGAEHRARQRVRRALEDPRDAEVDDPRDEVPVGLLHEHVPRLEIAVNHPLIVRCLQAGEDAVPDLGGHVEGHRAPPRRHELGEGARVDVLHDQRDELAVRDDVVHGHHVGVRQQARDPALAQEPAAHARVADEVGLQHLERDPAAQRAVGREVHGGHPTFADPPLEDVAGDAHAGAQEAPAHGERRRGHVGRARVGRIGHEHGGPRAVWARERALGEHLLAGSTAHHGGSGPHRTRSLRYNIQGGNRAGW